MVLGVIYGWGVGFWAALVACWCAMLLILAGTGGYALYHPSLQPAGGRQWHIWHTWHHILQLPHHPLTPLALGKGHCLT